MVGIFGLALTFIRGLVISLYIVCAFVSYLLFRRRFSFIFVDPNTQTHTVHTHVMVAAGNANSLNNSWSLEVSLYILPLYSLDFLILSRDFPCTFQLFDFIYICKHYRRHHSHTSTVSLDLAQSPQQKNRHSWIVWSIYISSSRDTQVGSLYETMNSFIRIICFLSFDSRNFSEANEKIDIIKIALPHKCN